MRKMVYLFIISISTISILGCTSMQPIKVPEEGTYNNKLNRFYYMQDSWSYLNNDWTTGGKVTAGMLHRDFNVNMEQASSELLEFKKIQRHYNGMQRFLASIYLLNVRYYVNY